MRALRKGRLWVWHMASALAAKVKARREQLQAVHLQDDDEMELEIVMQDADVEYAARPGQVLSMQAWSSGDQSPPVSTRRTEKSACSQVPQY